MRTTMLAFGVLVMAGCQAPVPSPDVSNALDTSLVKLRGATATGEAPLFWNGTTLAEGELDTIPFEVVLPPGYWEKNTGAIEVSLSWDYRDDLGLAIRVYRSNGQLVEEQEYGYNSITLLLDELASGSYYAEVEGEWGVGSYRGVVQVESRPKGMPVEELLPNLVALPPSELKIAYQDRYWPFFLLPEVSHGCSPYEVVERQAGRCLRFTNRVGNAGEGSLTLLLRPDEKAKSAAGSGHWVQRVWRTDGSYREQVVGGAEFHPTHHHVHYAGMAGFELFSYDPDKGTRGAAVAQGRKTGFAFADSALVALGLPGTARGDACYDELGYPEWPVGWVANLYDTCLSANWYDIYGWGTDDQFVDVTGVGDGTYELVSTANVAGTAIESNAADNSASTFFTLKGDAIRILPR